MQLNVRAFALAFAILGAIGFFVLTWWLIILGGTAGEEGAASEAPAIARIYLGYTVSAGGSIVGLIWGFVHGLIWGGIFAWVYNLIAARMPAGEQPSAEA